MTEFIYLASPYTHGDPNVQQERYEKITRIGARLTEKYGHAFFLPITQSHQLVEANPNLNGSFESWEEIDLTVLSRCDALWVVTLDGWRASRGVLAEIKFAEELNIPIKYIGEDHGQDRA